MNYNPTKLDISRNNQNVFGWKLKQIRIAKGMSQKELAEMINVSPSHISNIEKGTFNGSVDFICRIADVLDCDLNNLLRNKRIVLTTYSENPIGGKMTVNFSVPIDWLLEIIEEENLQHFIETYTLDESLEIKHKAKLDEVYRYIQP